MDNGELLLDKSFLDTCSTAYGVVPRTQENQGQPFVSKHFNVIDPLRTNNNLGRSVSKGKSETSTYFKIYLIDDLSRVNVLWLHLFP